MARCAAIKPNGERCKVEAIADAEWCWSHHPDYEQARQRRASKGGKRGGRGRPQAELTDIKTLLSDLTEQVLSGELETGRAAVANQLINTRLRAIELERKIREAEEIEERLSALEALAKNGGRSRWGT
jgi:hypothetical protein